MYKVEKDVPMPTKTKSGRTSKYPFAEMKPGDSFALKTADASKVAAAASNYATSNNQKFAVRKDGRGYRCWRIK